MSKALDIAEDDKHACHMAEGNRNRWNRLVLWICAVVVLGAAAVGVELVLPNDTGWLVPIAIAVGVSIYSGRRGSLRCHRGEKPTGDASPGR